MRKYECTFIINPEKEEEAKQIIEGIKTHLVDDKGKVNEIDEWGIKTLAYEIKGHNNGYYTVINFELDPDKANSFKELMQKSNDILRYILVVKGN